VAWTALLHFKNACPSRAASYATALQEVRWDPEKYPYLLFDSAKQYQECAAKGTDKGPCLAELAKKNDANGAAHINIWILGYSQGVPDGLGIEVGAILNR
jgi:hypothetical protein